MELIDHHRLHFLQRSYSLDDRSRRPVHLHISSDSPHQSKSGSRGGSVGSESGDDLNDRITSEFHVGGDGSIVPESHESADRKLEWLRSQIIGQTADFDTPFGSRRLTYADHTASGRSLHYIENYIATKVLPFYGNSHTSDSQTGYQTTRMVHEASAYVKKCLGGGSGDAIIFCGSGTTAAIKRLQEVMGIAISPILRDRMLKCLSEEERWVVFVGPYEHHSNILSWRQSLAEVVEIGLDGQGLIDINALKEKLDYYKAMNRPMLGSFSACSNVTGICTDTRRIAKLVHQFGGFVCFDFAASGPYEKIDMRSGHIEGYDAVFLSPHKFVGGPDTPGILLMSKALYRLGSAPPSTCGGGTVDFVNGFNEEHTLYVDNIEEREDAGTPQIIQKMRAALTFWVKELIGNRTIEKMEQAHIGRVLKRLVPNPHIKVLGNTAVRRQAIVSFLIYTTTNSSSRHNTRGLDLWQETGDVIDKPLHGPFVAKLLNDLFGIQARGGCACAGPYGHSLLEVNEVQSLAFRSAIQKGYSGIKPGWTRVSFPYYMSEEELEFILAGIEFIAVYGQRFLPLYHFSWRKGTWTFRKSALKKEEYGMGLGRMMMRLKNDNNSNKGSKPRDLLQRYTSYLESARQIANVLPKFPAQRKVPEDLDMDPLPFRV